MGKSTSDDKQVIAEAYQDELKAMFGVLFKNSLVDGLDSAAQRFQDGLKKLQAARDRATQIVGQ